MAINYTQIGLQYFVSSIGDIAPQGQEIEEITEPFEDGRAFRKKGVRGAFTELDCLALATNDSAADTLLDTYMDMKATIVSVSIRGASRADYLVTDVGGFSRKEVRTINGGIMSDGSTTTAGNAAILVYSRWQLVYAST